jgi:hypothetical protein
MCPNRQQHRGAHPEDARLFAPAQIKKLQVAVSELSWLFSRGYAIKSALKLVGDRHNLTERQRLAVSRAACSEENETRRKEHLLNVRAIKGENIIIDGFNLIVTTEAALSGGLLLLCRDGCIRDLSSVHGSYRSVQETNEAIELIGATFEILKPASVKWLLDQPVSNSGRLAGQIKELARERTWTWTVEVVFNPDAEIKASNQIAVTSDSIILDGVRRWVNFNRHLVETYLPEAWVIDLRSS